MPESSNLLQLNVDHDKLIAGILYALLPIFIMPLYVIVIYLISSNDEYRRIVSYRLINLINICDFGQSICHSLSGLFLIFPMLEIKFQFIVRIIGCTANTLWLAMFPVMAILSVSRVRVVMNKENIKKMSKSLKTALFLTFCYMMFAWITGSITQNFRLLGVAWAYDDDVPNSAYFATIEYIITLPSLAISFLCYLIVIFSFYQKRKLMSKSIGNELSILIQATVTTTYLAMMVFLWHNVGTWFKESIRNLVMLNLLWVFLGYLNPIMLITVNRGFRRHVNSVLSCQKVFPAGAQTHSSKS